MKYLRILIPIAFCTILLASPGGNVRADLIEKIARSDLHTRVYTCSGLYGFIMATSNNSVEIAMGKGYPLMLLIAGAYLWGELELKFGEEIAYSKVRIWLTAVLEEAWSEKWKGTRKYTNETLAANYSPQQLITDWEILGCRDAYEVIDAKRRNTW